jgi:hypothetical protein
MVKRALILIGLFSSSAVAEAQYYYYQAPTTYMPLTCGVTWTADCEAAARMQELETQEQILKSLKRQNLEIQKLQKPENENHFRDVMGDGLYKP